MLPHYRIVLIATFNLFTHQCLTKRKHFHLFFRLHSSNEIISIMCLHTPDNPFTSENKSIISQAKNIFIKKQLTSCCFIKNHRKSKFKPKEVKEEKELGKKKSCSWQKPTDTYFHSSWTFFHLLSQLFFWKAYFFPVFGKFYKRDSRAESRFWGFVFS